MLYGVFVREREKEREGERERERERERESIWTNLPWCECMGMEQEHGVHIVAQHPNDVKKVQNQILYLQGHVHRE